MRALALCACFGLIASANGCSGASQSERYNIRAKGSNTVVRIKARQAKQKGLPAIGFSVDPAGTAMSASPFPEDGVYLTLSGPPGGPLLFQVFAYRSNGHDAAALDAQIKARFNQPHQQPLQLDEQGTLKLSGSDRAIRTFITGSMPMIRTRWCAALIPAPSGHAEGLFVVFGDAAPAVKTAECAAIVAHPHLAPLVRSFAVD